MHSILTSILNIISRLASLFQESKLIDAGEAIQRDRDNQTAKQAAKEADAIRQRDMRDNDELIKRLRGK